MPHAACFRKPRLADERVSDDRTATPFFIVELHAKICKSEVLSLVVQTAERRHMHVAILPPAKRAQWILVKKATRQRLPCHEDLYR